MARRPRSNGAATQDASDGAQTAALLQGSFTSGELAPALYARTDLSKFHSGAKFLQNFFVQAQGGVVNRAGTLYVGNAATAGATRLIPFSFSTLQTYVLVFQQGTIQLVSDGGFITQDGTSATPAITIVTPYAGADLFQITYCQDADVITLCHPSYPPATLTRMSATNWVYAAISPGSQLNAPNTTETQPANNVPSSASLTILTTPFQYGVTSVKISPPDESPLGNSKACTNYDLSYQDYNVNNTVYWVPNETTPCDYWNVYRYFEGEWSFCASTTGVLATSGTGSVSGTLALCWTDQNTTPDTNIAPPADTNPFAGGEFTGSINGTLMTLTGYTDGSIQTGDYITGPNVSGSPTVTGNISGASFSGSVNGTTLSVGHVYSGTLSVGDAVVGPGVVAGNTITASGSGTSGANEGIFLLSIGGANRLRNMMALPAGGAVYSVSTSQTAALGTLIDNVNYPAACGFFQQRAVFGGTNTAPAELFTSITGNYSNFNIRQPLQDSDAITATLANNQVNQIRHIVSMNDMVVFTNSGAWKVSGQSNAGDVLTPSNVVAIPQAYSGAAYPTPIIVSPDILYVQEKSAAVRDLAYNVYTNLYTGSDISELATHLFRGYQIVDWAWAQEPWKIVWAVRNDGALLGLTYQKEEDVCAWHHHITSGTMGPPGVATGPAAGGAGGSGGGGSGSGALANASGSLNAGIGGPPPRPYFTGNFTPSASIDFSVSLTQTILNVIESINTGGNTQFDIGAAPADPGVDPSVNFYGALSVNFSTGEDFPSGVGTGTVTCETGTLTTGSEATSWTQTSCAVGGCQFPVEFSGTATISSLGTSGSQTFAVGEVTFTGPNGTAKWSGVRFPGSSTLASLQSYFIQQDIAFVSYDIQITAGTGGGGGGGGGGSGGGTNYNTLYPGTFLSVASITETTAAGVEDVVYLAVGRVLQGQYVVTIERMQSRILGVGDADITQAWFVDCGLQYSNGGTLANTVSGLAYLAGQTVSILADGKVQPQQVVPSSGTLTLPISAAVITVGLPISAQMETLPLDAGQPTIQGKYKRLTKARAYVCNTRGIQMGPNTPNGPDLVEANARWSEPWGSPPNLYTGQVEIFLPGTWDTYGSMWVQQNYPLPACILGIEPWVSVGE